MSKNLIPALVYSHDGAFFAWDEYGDSVAMTPDLSMLLAFLKKQGYFVISPNSVIAADIRDWIRIKNPELRNQV
jgi:hypothetical protein